MKRLDWFLPLSSASLGQRKKEENHLSAAIKHKKMLRLYVTATLLISMMLTVYIWQQTKMVEIRLRIQQAEKQCETLETNNAVVRAEISKLQSIARIEKVARTELGMVTPQRICYFPLPPINVSKH